MKGNAALAVFMGPPRSVATSHSSESWETITVKAVTSTQNRQTAKGEQRDVLGLSGDYFTPNSIEATGRREMSAPKRQQYSRWMIRLISSSALAVCFSLAANSAQI